jgi:hypothetical protein
VLGQGLTPPGAAGSTSATGRWVTWRFTTEAEALVRKTYRSGFGLGS